MAKGLSEKVVFIATAAAADAEMKQRIKLHQKSRPKHWRLIEEHKNLIPLLARLNGKHEVVLIDCLGLLIANLMVHQIEDKPIEREVTKLIAAVAQGKRTAILVSNDVGSGLVSTNPLARRFCDLLGRVNQMVAKAADQVILMQAGIPVKIKNHG